MTFSKRTLLILLCFCVTQLQAQLTPGPEKNPLANKPEAIKVGKKTYENSCQLCHGGDGRGGRGPALATGNFQHGGEDWQLFQNIRRGIAATQMPAFELPNNEIWELVTYLRSLSGTVTEEVVEGDVAAGARLFAEKGACLTCHEVNGQGGRLGPDLSIVGKWTAKALREAILNPNQREGREPNTVFVKTKDGQEIRGLRKNEDSFTLQLMDIVGDFHLLQKKDLAETKYEEKSLMPEDYGKQFSGEELQNLVAYLKSLQARNLAKVSAVPLEGGLAYDRIRHSGREPRNWLTYFGDYQGRHYSDLSEITPANVNGLQTRWAFQAPVAGNLQATPLVVDGIMFTTGYSGSYVVALDARSGRPLWQHRRPAEGQPNRGVAVLGGRVFFTCADAYVVALDAKTGRMLWESQMADAKAGYSASMAPLALKDKIITGISGGEFGIRGFIDAYDPATGKRLWRFYTIPGPGEFGNDTWEGDSWKRGGAPTWMTGTYDPETDTLYWGVGNAGPDLDGEVRKGDNLFTSSIVALDAATGKRRWHFQFTPHDTHDWDSNETPVLVDRPFQGQQRKLLLHADRNGFFYVLDRINGKFLLGKPFVRQTWARGLDENGRPILVPNSEASLEGQLHYPSLSGGTNWQAPSYDPVTGWFFLAFREMGDVYIREPGEYVPGKSYWGGKAIPAKDKEWGGVKALDPESGEAKWEFRFIYGSLSAGVLATRGGVVFAACRDGNLVALESRTGRLLWRFQTGAEISSSPIGYAVDGRQYIALCAGQVLYSFALPDLLNE
jgi:PQQ-dependent dehydrogenase (methanol/ethanol family)